MKYTNLLQQKSEFQRVFASVSRLQQTTKLPDLSAIDKQKNRLMAADAMRDAAEFSKRRAYQDAHNALLNAERFIIESPSASDPYCKEYISSN